MKYKTLVCLMILSLSLGACGTKQEQEKEGTQTSQATPTHSTNSSLKKSDKESSVTVQYNGTYYSVKGKSGQEIILVNKKHPLDANYAPGEDPTAKTAFLALIAEMKSEGFSVSDQYSGYRSYETQVGLYQSYVNNDGQANADRYSARPGYSEHQTGLAFDIIDTAGNLLTESRASQWLLEHAADYGFIVRYQEDKENVTGYTAESWHLRYIGEEAKEIANSGLTLEEYFNVPGGDYEE